MPGPKPPRPEGLAVPAVLLLATLLLCAPLLLNEHLPLGSDVYVTHHYAKGFRAALDEGVIYPRWLEGTNQGMGAPVFVYYPPLPWYGVALLSWIFPGFDAAFRVCFVLLTLLSGLAFYQLARQWAGPGIPSALAAGLYLLLPYHSLDLYYRFALSELTAFVFLPLVLLYARRVLLVGRFTDHLFLVLSWAGLLLTHIVSAIPFVLLFVPWLILEGRSRPAALARCAAALGMGLLLAAPVLLPVALEREYANVAWYRLMPNGDFRINFLFRHEVLPGLGIRDAIKPPVFRAAHTQLLLGAVAAALALLWTAKSQGRRRRDVLAMASWTAAAYLMQVPPATPVWLAIPLLPSIQFPWRFQVQMVLSVSLLAAWALSAGWGRAGGREAGRRGGLASWTLLLAGAVLLNLALTWQTMNLKEFAYTEELDRHPAVQGWIEPAMTPVQFESFRRFKELRIEIPRASFVEGEGRGDVALWESARRVVETVSEGGGTLRLRTFWFPGWVATIDGAPAPIHPDPLLAAITLRVPPGSHRVEVRFAETAVRRAGLWIGALAIPLTPLLCVLLARRRRVSPGDSPG